jgi:putative phosphoribosyl transferase
MNTGDLTSTFVFRDRADAGRRLAEALAPLKGRKVVVLGLPRGGVPVAAEVARALSAPLDVVVVRKLGLPFQSEVAMGAIGEDGVRVLDQHILGVARVTDDQLAVVEKRERTVLEARVRHFRHDRARIDLTGRTAVIVDDGIATGATASAACRIVRAMGAARVVLAAPVGSPLALRAFTDADEIICPLAPPHFTAVGRHYVDFRQTSDEEVVDLLDEAARRVAAPAASAAVDSAAVDVHPVTPAPGGPQLEGSLS